MSSAFMSAHHGRKPFDQTIVVVEDERIAAEDVRRRLESWGYRVQAVVASGEEAIRTAEATQPDLMLMDIHLKGKMDGVEAARRIKARSDIPVIYATSYVDPATLERARLTDPSGVINKPYDDHEMQSAIASALSRRTMERRIAEAEDRYRRLVATSSELIFLRKGRRILSANGAALRVLGYPLEELLRYDVAHFAGADCAALLTSLLEEVEKGQACSNVEVQMLSRAGNPLSVALSAEMCVQNGESVMQIVMTNTTERRSAEEEAARFAEELFDAKAEAEESTRQLRQKHRELARLRDAVAQEHATHLSLVEQCRQDVQTPTATLHDLLSVFDATEPTPDLRRHLDEMRTAVRALHEVRFPDLPAVSSGQRSLAVRMQRMDVRQLVLRLIDTYARRARQKGIALSARVATDVPEEVISDPDRLTEVLGELLANAVRHTLRGEVLVNVRLEPRDGQSGALRCEVIDTGEGVPQDYLSRLFLPYRQHEQPLLQAGMADGVGLALCRQILERLGGTLGAESRLGSGSTFWCLVPFTIPLQLAPPQSPLELPLALPAQSGPNKPAMTAAPIGTPRVLVADDEEVNRAIARRMMESLGCIVDVASDGQEAVEAARSSSYALVILDCRMPGLDGFQAAAAIRTLSTSSPQLRIVAMSADMREEDQRRYMAAGMDDTIGKPLNIERLRLLLARWGLQAGVAGART